jgi:hypothetical protein
MNHKTALVCGKYELPVQAGEARKCEGESQALGYYEYINHRTKETGKNLMCVQHLIRDLPQGLSIYEPFGGVGAFAALLQGQLRPSSHVMCDIDPDCYNQLRFAFGNQTGVRVTADNARTHLGTERADLFVCDFPFHTIMRYKEWKNEWARMTQQKPMAIVWMDGAISKLHLHTKTYSKNTGRTITRDPQTYAQAMSEILYADTGYSITESSYSWACSYFIAKPVPPSQVAITRYSGSGDEGFRWTA